MNTALNTLSTRQTPQSEPIFGANQVENSAGGYSWEVSDWTRLHRFLVLGSEGGSYYASEQKLTLDNADTLLRCLASDGDRYLKEVVDISRSGRAPKNEYAIFALALAAAKGDEKTRTSVREALPFVCRTGTHLFQFASFSSQLRGWGRGLRRAVASWYENAPNDRLALQLVKYRARFGYTHRDLLRLSHPLTSPEARSHQDINDSIRADLYEWACGRLNWDQLGAKQLEDLPKIIVGYELAKRAKTVEELVDIIRDYRLTHECLESQWLAQPAIWEALLESMPMGAMVRNLARMTMNGLLTPQAKATQKILAQLQNKEAILASRLHPISILGALKTYEQGHGQRGKLEWSPVPQIVDALDGAFYKAFANVEPTGTRKLLALDVSSSMEWGMIAGVPGLTPRVASAALALVCAATEPNYQVVAFERQLTPLTISPRQRLDDVLRLVNNLPFGGTDCSLPMTYALEHSLEIDTFIIYTDSETWAGRTHPAQALKRYREQSGINARLVVCGMCANNFTIADPKDSGMLDVVGFDTATPALVSDFERGLI